MRPRRISHTGAALMLLVMSSLSACAGRHPRPPPEALEALEACRVTSSGEVCNSRHRVVRSAAPAGRLKANRWRASLQTHHRADRSL